ncbi:transmembrane protein 71 isoform X3 [Manis javanica]|uniref:transmembrane protein 71 isoform X3 n=1 Tax=Manis javanica TaxID=9974 RepID=UPI003C6D440F
MYRISQLMSTPVASQCSSGSKRECTGQLSPSCIFPSLTCDFLESDSSFECCSIDPLTGPHFTCRRSPRLLTNGYYVWTEDSFLWDKDGSMTLSPPQTSVLYKENLVRIFRKKKRIRRPLASLFNLSTSKSWLRGMDAVQQPGYIYICENSTSHEGGGDFDCFLTGNAETTKPNAERVTASSSQHVTSQAPRDNSHSLSLQSQLTSSALVQGSILGHSRTSLLREVSFQAIMLAACLIISACGRWFLGGILAPIFTCLLMITIAYAVKLLFPRLASYFKATTCAQFAKI